MKFGVPRLRGLSSCGKCLKRRLKAELQTANIRSVGHPTETCLVPPAHGDHGEIRIGEEIFPDRTLALEQFETCAALLALADRNGIEHRIDADHFVDILLELVDAFNRETH